MRFNNSWLGYDVAFDAVESQPDVLVARAEGFEKRIKTKEYHVTAAYFPDVDLRDLVLMLTAAERNFGRPLDRTSFLFDGQGRLHGDGGAYLYFSPNASSAEEARFLKTALAKTPLYIAEQNCDDLHLSIGGPDPFGRSKPRQSNLPHPFTLDGRLIFVGHDGKKFHKFAWRSAEQVFEEMNGSQKKMPLRPVPVHTIALLPRIQADTASAAFLLKTFGERLYPGISKAGFAFYTMPPDGKTPEEMEREGTLMVDLGGRYDHHRANIEQSARADCVSTLIARDLGLENHPSLKKLLAWAKRDDLEGKGTVSSDVLDRAFGLSGIIMSLNRFYDGHPEQVLRVVLPILRAHVQQEYESTVELPAEREQLQKEGRAQSMTLTQGPAELETAVVQSDNTALPGFLRAAHKFDVVIIRRATGHTNILTNQLRSVDLRPVIRQLREAEAKARGLTLTATDAVGRQEGLPMWFYDDAANTVQNGGANPGETEPTRLPLEKIVSCARSGLAQGHIGMLKRQKEQGK